MRELSRRHPSEVIVFPDRSLDTDESMESRGLRFREILNSSRPFDRLLRHLSSARTSVDVCLYLLTSQQLADAVLGTMRRGARVRLILDHENVALSGSQVPRFYAAGAFVRSRPSDYIMHHKFAVIDGRKVVTGSFNWTMQAVMGNKENVVVTEEPGIVAAFEEEFEWLWREMGRDLEEEDEDQSGISISWADITL